MGLSLPKSNLIFLKKCLDKWVHFTFQYISCCSLSHMVNHEAYNVKHFNTSHVVVYRMNQLKGRQEHNYFNTSHVVVYRMNQLKGRQEQNYFNTSHVVVYLATDVAVFLSANISIHLML